MVALKLIEDVDVEFFPYRTASVGDKFLSAPREELREFERDLAKRAGVECDNHTVYALTCKLFREEETTYILFTDGYAIFGRTIEKRR